MKSLKLNSYPGDNVTDLCTVILVDHERLESADTFNTEQLGHITCIYEDTYYSRFRFLEIQIYKEDKEFIKDICVCDLDVIQLEEIITNELLIKKATR